jgi:hypothetical protein
MVRVISPGERPVGGCDHFRLGVTVNAQCAVVIQERGHRRSVDQLKWKSPIILADRTVRLRTRQAGLLHRPIRLSLGGRKHLIVMWAANTPAPEPSPRKGWRLSVSKQRLGALMLTCCNYETIIGVQSITPLLPAACFHQG